MPPIRALTSLGPSGRPKPIHVIDFIPPAANFIYKLEIVTDTETIDFTEKIVDGFFTEGVTSTIGDFDFKILDPSNSISDRVEEFDTVKVYLDYGSSATTLKFNGRIERKNNTEYTYLNITGRSVAMIATETNITYSSNGPMARSEILKAVFNIKKSDEVTPKYFGGLISTAGIEDDLTEVSKTYEEVPFWDFVEDLCNNGERDAYISPELVMNYFVKGSRKNSTEAIVEGINLIKPKEYAKDTEEIATKVRVYGQSTEGIPIIATSTSNTTNTKGIDKVFRMDNTNISTTSQAEEFVNYQSTNKLVAPTLGVVDSIILPTLSPGEKLRITSPVNNIPPEYYEINSYTHSWSETGSPETSVVIKKQRLDLPNILKKNIKTQVDVIERVNPNDMDFSQVIKFDTDSGTHVNTEINEDYLKVVVGQNSGRWESDLFELGSKVKAVEFRFKGDKLTQQYSATTSNLWYSFNGGTTWHLKPISGSTVRVPTGRDLKIRIDLNSSDAQVKVVSFLYRF